MSLLGSLFSSGTSGLNKSAAEAERRLALARQQAEGALREGQGAGLGSLNTGYDQALARYAAAEPGIRADLTGGYDQARGDLNAGYDAAAGQYGQYYDQARQDYTTGATGAEAAVTDYTGRANAALDPFLQSGTRALSRRDAALGITADGGNASAADVYSAATDPATQYRDEQLNKQLQSQFNARGIGGSGRFGKALASESLERASADMNGYRDRLERAAQAGQQVAGQVSGNNMSAGGQISGIRTGLGSQLGGAATQAGGFMGQNAANRGTALAGNSVAQGSALAGLGASMTGARSALDVGRGQGLAGIQTGTGSQLSNLIYGHGQQTAANEINLGNATRAARAAPGQNLMNLAGTAMQAYGAFKPPTAQIGQWQTTARRN